MRRGNHSVLLILADAIIRIQASALGLVCRILFAERGTESNAAERILLLRTGGLGDFLFAVPAMAIVRRRFPRAKIWLLTAISTDRKVIREVVGYTGGEGKLPWSSFICPGTVDR